MKDYPGKPPRLDRFFREHPIFFCTLTTLDRQAILANDMVHGILLDHARRSARRGVAWYGRYVIMPDHMHLFIRPAQPHRLGLLLGRFEQRVTMAIGRPGKVWQPGLFDHVLRSPDSYEQKWAYVRENPVRAGLVPRPEDWPYQGEIDRLEF